MGVLQVVQVQSGFQGKQSQWIHNDHNNMCVISSMALWAAQTSGYVSFGPQSSDTWVTFLVFGVGNISYAEPHAERLIHKVSNQNIVEAKSLACYSLHSLHSAAAVSHQGGINM